MKKNLIFNKNNRERYLTLLKLLFFFGVVFMLVSSGFAGEVVMIGHDSAQYPLTEELSFQQLKTLSQKKIFFGHQSVGNNIIQGINDILEEYPKINLKIVRTKNKDDFYKPIFAQYEIGTNDYPLTKIEDFVRVLDEGVGNNLDIAMMKFCFVDITSATDIDNVFLIYKKSMEQLKARFPDITLVHFTVPLLRKEKQQGLTQNIKTFFKKIMGKKNDGFFSDIHNVARNKYNKLIVDYYTGKEPVFDLARLESTNSTGKRERFVSDSHEYYALVPEYTEDGGHLNKKGRQYIAEQLLVFLANL